MFDKSVKKGLLNIALLSTVLLGGCAHTEPKRTAEVYRYENGKVSFEVVRDSQGRFHGKALGYWPSGQLAEESYWDHGTPLRGKFYNEKGLLFSEIKNGTGHRVCPEFSEYYRNGKYVRGGH